MGRAVWKTQQDVHGTKQDGGIKFIWSVYHTPMIALKQAERYNESIRTRNYQIISVDAMTGLYGARKTTLGSHGC